VRTSEVGKTVSLQQIQTTPQVSRNFLEFADAVPGMIFTRDAKGNTSLRGGATNADGTNVYIDGVGQKSYVKGGGVAGQSGSAGNPFPQLAIGEYKVISGNYKAEYGQVSSAASRLRPSRVPTSSRVRPSTVTPTKHACDDPGRAPAGQGKDGLGREGIRLRPGRPDHPGQGPLLRDLRSQALRSAGDHRAGWRGHQRPPLPADAAGLGPASQPFQQDLIFAKIDFEPTDNDRIELTFQDRDETQQQFSGQTAPKPAGSGQHRPSLRAALEPQR
jgi:hypothetical protein